MVSFTQFVLSFENEPTSYGDLARDVRADVHVCPTWAFRSLKKHITKMGAIPVVFVLLDEINVMHKLLMP
jgi:hypothetical protein